MLGSLGYLSLSSKDTGATLQPEGLETVRVNSREAASLCPLASTRRRIVPTMEM
jgi:hypothetical protein